MITTTYSYFLGDSTSLLKVDWVLHLLIRPLKKILSNIEHKKMDIIILRGGKF